MAESRNRQFAKLAKDITSAGDIKESGISSDVNLGGATIYATRSSLPSSGNTAGDQAYVTDNNRLYIWNGSGWYNIALLNVAPSITSVLDSDSGTTPFTLSTTGAVTRVTITATDSDGDPLTYESSADSDFSGLATLSQSSNVFTITPLSQDSATTTSGTITFTATDGVNVASSGIQTFTLSFVSALWDETVLSVGTSSTNSLDNDTFIDRSGNNGTATYSSYGTHHVQNAEHPYLNNWSVKFAGTSGVLYTADNADFAYGTGDLTVEVWFYPTATPSNQVIIDQRESSPSGGGYSIECGSNLIPYLATSVSVLSGTIAMNLNEWNHIVYTRSGTDLSLFVNGNRSNTATNSTNFTSQRLTIGGYTQRASSLAYGYIKDARLVKGTSVYDPTSTTITVPTEPLTAITNTVLLTCQSNRFIDNSSSGHSITVSGATQVSAFNPFGQGSEYTTGENKGSIDFDTTSGYAFNVAGSSLGSTWTIECWYKWNSSTTIETNHYMFDARASGTFYLYRSTTTQYNTPNVNPALSDTNFNDGAWHWLVISCDGTNLTAWVDGNRVTTGTGTSTIGTFLWVNSRGPSNQYQNDCKISDLRVSSTARYAYTATSITVPTSPVGYDGNTSAYYPMDNAGIYDKTGNNYLALAGNTATSTTQTKYATTSMYFDGTGDYVQIPDASQFDLTGDFTIELWVYHTSTTDTGYSAIFGGNGSGSNGWNIYMIESSGNLYFYHSTFLVTATSALTVNTWHHVAVSRSGSSLKMFVDGTQVGSTATTSATLVQNDSNLGTRLGYDIGANGYFEGYIEGVQLLNGVAKYTANFTAPTQTQGRQYQASS